MARLCIEPPFSLPIPSQAFSLTHSLSPIHKFYMNHNQPPLYFPTPLSSTIPLSLFFFFLLMSPITRRTSMTLLRPGSRPLACSLSVRRRPHRLCARSHTRCEPRRRRSRTKSWKSLQIADGACAGREGTWTARARRWEGWVDCRGRGVRAGDGGEECASSRAEEGRASGVERGRS